MHRHKLFRTGSIKKSIMYSFLVLVVSTLLIFLAVSLPSTSHAIMENSIYYGRQVNGRINGEIDAYIDYMENLSDMVVHNEDVPQYLFYHMYEGAEAQKILENSNYSSAYALDRESLYIRITDQFSSIMESRQDIANIGILYNEDNYIFDSGQEHINPNIELSDVDWITKTKQQADGMNLSASHVQNLVEDDYRWVITLSRVIHNSYTNERQGIFFVDLNYEVISDLCEKDVEGERGYVFILDSDGNIIYHPRQQLLYSGLAQENIEQILSCKDGYFVTDEKDGRLYTMSVSEKTGWTVVGVSYMDELLKEQKRIYYIFCLTAAVLIVAAIVLSNILAGKITLPILRLKESMREVEKGNFANASVDIMEENEIGSLGRSFNVMTEEIQNLMEQNVNEQREKRKSELKALQAQINPHFLYNTLDSIIWMAESGETDEVVRMTSSLAHMMRQSLNTQEQIPLEREFEHVRSYLTIQKMRYQDKLNFEIVLSDAIRCMPIVKLVVQPLVENAIYHGIRCIEGMGMIWISARCVDGEIWIEVRDNGVGMEAEKLEHIFDKHKVNYSSNGVGVYNVQQRLQLTYGSEYGLAYESRAGEGTCVTIRIPGGGI